MTFKIEDHAPKGMPKSASFTFLNEKSANLKPWKTMNNACLHDGTGPQSWRSLRYNMLDILEKQPHGMIWLIVSKCNIVAKTLLKKDTQPL